MEEIKYGDPGYNKLVWSYWCWMFFQICIVPTGLLYLYLALSREINLTSNPEGLFNWIKMVGSWVAMIVNYFNVANMSERIDAIKKRALDDYERSRSVESNASISQSDKKSPSSVVSSDESIQVDDAVYSDENWARALEEYDSPSRNNGLWARLYAQFKGDEVLVKAEYLKIRVKQLSNIS